MNEEDAYKYCPDCKCIYPIIFFWKSDRHKNKFDRRCIDCAKEYRETYVDKEYDRNYTMIYNWKIKQIVFQVYSNGIMKCRDCCEDDIDVLVIEHIYGKGRQHRKQLNVRGGIPFYNWLIKNNFPEGYSLLCHNCNWRMRNKRLYD